MGILKALRRYAPHAVDLHPDAFRNECTGFWRPAADVPEIVTGTAMDDDGCSGERAYGASFVLTPSHSAHLIIWCYPTYAGPAAEDGHVLGYRVECRAGNWTVSYYTSEALRNGGVSFDIVFMDLDDAGSAAQWMAARLMAGDDAILPVPGCLREYFDWDGTPW